MDISKIALVRSINSIPFNGVIEPLSNYTHLTKSNGTILSGIISDLLKEEGITRKITPDLMFSSNYDDIVEENSRTIREYLPYSADYNSMVLFSVNGICPDDNENGFGNNIFSKNKVGVIEPLAPHINEAVSLCPTDVAIKGNVTLSKDAVILIDEEFASTLTEHEVAMLKSTNLTIKTFKGSLKDAITNELINMGYTPEVLSLSVSSGGFMPSDTSEELKENLSELASTYGISQTKFFNLISNPDPNMPRYEMVEGEFRKFNQVYNYYSKMFLEALLTHMGVDKELTEVLSTLSNKTYELKVKELIKSFGIENYKNFVDSYNASLLEKREKGLLETPEEIVSSLTNKGIHR